MQSNISTLQSNSRWSCLRIHGIPLSKSTETATDCVNKVTYAFKEIGVAVPDDAIDRPHRIGVRGKDRNTAEFKQAMIVKFIARNHRNAVYRGCKKSSRKHILLDMKAKRAKLLKWGKEKAKIYGKTTSCLLK